MTELTFEGMRCLENYGHSQCALSYYFQPQAVDKIADVFKLARDNGLTVSLRGAGRSYNDAALNGGGIVLNLQSMNSIVAWDPQTGIIQCQPGVTLRELWQKVLPDGWWPAVVSGTMSTTLGGCLGMNIHGKNNYKAGTIGDHVLEFTALLPSGAELVCSPRKNGDLFHAMIGGLGMLGVFTSITLQMKHMYSGLLQVQARNVPNLSAQLDDLDSHKDEADYIVGWMDCTARGRGLGRGQIHQANYLPEGKDPDPSRSMNVAFQTLPDKFFGLVPKSLLHYFMAPFMTNPGTRLVNTAKYIVGRNKIYLQPHAAFHFLLDYVPNWELSYGRGGLIQYQSFLPKDTALEAWSELLSISHKRNLPSYLGVTKRHRKDDFLLSHAVDGFSLAMDFKVTRSNCKNLKEMLQDFDRIVLQAGGRFYFAKNSETLPGTALKFLSMETIQKFKKLKNRCDPDGLLASDLYRRVFEPMGQKHFYYSPHS